MFPRLILLTVLCVAVSVPARAQEDNRPIWSFAALPRIGEQSPDFRFPLLSGDTVSLASLKGRPAVLVMWAVWCSGSRAILADVEAVSRHYSGRPISVVILADDDRTKLEHFVSSNNLVSQFAVAGGRLQQTFDHSSTAPERHRVRVEWALPLWLVIDGDGKVVYRNGGPNAKKVMAVADSLLAN